MTVNRHAPPVVAVTGFKNAGKTTAIEGVLRELTRCGYRVATLKHSHCGFDVDRPGKDSWRHRQAGALGTAMFGPEGLTVIRDGESDPVEAVAWLFPDADLVLAEGFHWLPLPRVEVLDREGLCRHAHPEGYTIGALSRSYGLAEVREIVEELEALILSQPGSLSWRERQGSGLRVVGN